MQDRSHQIWSGQVSGVYVSMQQLGGSGGMPPPPPPPPSPPKKFGGGGGNLEAMRLLLRPFLDQNNASCRPDDRVLHA